MIFLRRRVFSQSFCKSDISVIVVERHTDSFKKSKILLPGFFQNYKEAKIGVLSGFSPARPKRFQASLREGGGPRQRWKEPAQPKSYMMKY